MKKFTVLFLAGILMTAYCTLASAQAPKLEFRASGFIDAQTFLTKNVPQRNTRAGLYQTYATNSSFGFTGAPYFVPTNALNRTASYWDARASLKFDAIMGPNLSGTIMFEIDAKRWGNSGGGGFLSGPANGREEGTFGFWNTDRTAVEVKNIYIDFGLPYFGIPVPITMRVGAQPIGVRPAMFLYSDGMGITAGIKIDPVLISPIYAKPIEGLDFESDDTDVYGLHVNAKLGTFTVGGYGLYYNMNTYPFLVAAPTGIPGFPAALTPFVPGTNKANMWWLGAYVDGKAGPINLNFDFVYDNGYVQHGRGGGVVHYRSVDYEGWATRLKIDYPWEKFNLGAVGMYASGGDTYASSRTGLPGSATVLGTASRRFSGYVVPPGSEQDTANNESVVVYGMDAGASGGIGEIKIKVD